MPYRPLSCQCGTFEWALAPDAPGTRLVCYCADCQSFVRHLGAPYRDSAGGVHLYQSVPAKVTILKGAEHLRLMQLSPKGTFRWYADCCNTPMAATLRFAGFPFVGLVLPPDETGFGKIRARAFTTHAQTKVKQHGMGLVGLGILKRGLVARLTGGHRDTPFFDANGAPRVAPQVITLDERNAARP